MKPQIENLKEYTSKLTLTSEEKFDMFQNIRAYSNTHPIRSRYSIFMKHSFVYASMLALLVGTAGTSIAAEEALPGDILYPVKTNINEEVVKTLAFTNIQKAKVAVSRIDKRMSELEKMIVLSTDSPAKIDIIVAKLEEHKADLQDFTDQVELTDTVEVAEASEIYAALDSVIDAHIDILEEIKEDVEDQLAVADTPNTLVTKTVSPFSTEMDTPIDSTVVLTMRASVQEVPSDNIDATTTEATTTPVVDSTITGEQDAITEVLNFSAGFDSLITSHKEKVNEDENITKHKSDIRKRIIETAESEFKIDVDEDTKIEIQTIIK